MRALDRGVDPRRIGLEAVPNEAVDRLSLAAGEPVKSQRAHQAIDLQARWSRELREPSGGRAPEELELPQPVLAVAEAHRKGEIEMAARAYVRHAQAIADDVH